ncbi:MAG: DNA mismatch repair protein MutS [Bacteroidales bacterium]|nr:DNA mismatch repair protein MutS [Bacteroidales bacterium]MDD4711746.1 DNA mismatch repair protein MutS [Bacteroidales bacterium]
MTKIIENTPLIKQYFEMKSKHPDAVLLFRVGDFYEAYGKDALEVVDILSIALTKKSNGEAGPIEMCGFPHHALDNFLPKLVRAGRRVAICDQLEDPKMTKKLVKRGITELVTPGVSTNENILSQKENNFLASLHIDKYKAGLALLDISTGEFLTAEGSFEYVDKLLNSFAPKEVLYERAKRSLFVQYFHHSGAKFELEDWVFTEDSAMNRLLKQFQTKNLKGFGIQNMPFAIIASGAILYYMDMTEHTQLDHIQSISRIEEDRFVRLDRYTIRSLEICDAMNDGGKSLLSVLDKTQSSMGGRLLRRWLLFPLKDVKAITERQDIVEYFFKNPSLRDFINEKLAQIGDLERIVSKISVGRISPRELVYLKTSLQAIDEIKQACLKVKAQNDSSDLSEEMEDTGFRALMNLIDQLNPCHEIRDRIQKEIVDTPPIALNRGEVIRNGVNADLDELRTLSASGKDYLAGIQERETERTGINRLKISYNNVFGYYIEVSNSQKDKVPEEWIRKQTLVNAERYITQELKIYEEKILGAEEKIAALELALFNDLVSDLTSYMSDIQKNAVQIAQLDCLLCFAKVAVENKYFRPQVIEGDAITIRQGRHPVIEKQLSTGEPYIANDIYLDSHSEQILIITGPNMAGKSALLRQTALIVLMAQIGSFVPADSAEIGLVDKIFTRVGASDNISSGESTFMIEMNEAADILNNISQHSLVLFDELGRGTSTYDGISLAWAIVEYIHEHPKYKAKTLFATHYHELNEMEKTFPRIKNYNVSVREADGKVIFLRKLERGGTEHSFGIHVAKMAGMPQSILKRANQILGQMEAENRKGNIAKPTKEIASERSGMQLSIFQLDDPVLSQIRDEIIRVDVNNLTPLEALNKLSDIKRILKGKK